MVSWFQCKNRFWKICTESRDIGKNVSNFDGMLTVLRNIRSTKVLHHASCIERRPSVEDDLPWTTTFGGRQPSVEGDLWWKTTFGERPPSGKDNLRWKATFGGRNLNCYQLSQPEIENASVEKFMRHCACTHMQNRQNFWAKITKPL